MAKGRSDLLDGFGKDSADELTQAAIPAGEGIDILGMVIGEVFLAPHLPLLFERLRELSREHSEAAQTLEDHRVLASVGSVGDADDNALAESFVDSFKTELVADRVWRARSQLELATVEYVGWFNTSRLHESLGDVPPAEYEAAYLAHQLESKQTAHAAEHLPAQQPSQPFAEGGQASTPTRTGPFGPAQAARPALL